MFPKISILVPVYNAADFIEKCVRSLFEQSFEELEFIFVDDCSTDNGIDILKKVISQYPHRLPYIKIVSHDKNQGVAVTRNDLVALASGEFVLFVDSDDYIDLDTTELLYNKSVDEDADIVVSDVAREYRKGKKTQQIKYCPDPKKYTQLMIAGETPGYCCAKLIRLNLYLNHNITCKEGVNILEDYHTVTRLCYFAKSIAKVHKPLYHYVLYNEDAATKSWNKIKFDNVIESQAIVETFFNAQHDAEIFAEAIKKMKLRMRVNFIIMSSKELRSTIIDQYADVEAAHIHFKYYEKLILKLATIKCYVCLNIFITVYRNAILWKKKLIG